MSSDSARERSLTHAKTAPPPSRGLPPSSTRCPEHDAARQNPDSSRSPTCILLQPGSGPCELHGRLPGVDARDKNLDRSEPFSRKWPSSVRYTPHQDGRVL